ncbi:MAG: hypothetical protein FWG27_06930 [Treponema sp.]|nr:hypothetical protein [Treponema sp.]
MIKTKFYFAAAVLMFFISFALFGQLTPVISRELSNAISSRAVTLTARGNGGSSGTAVLGSLKNNTENEIRINVILNGGVYLRNSGSGQNMIAAQVFLFDGGYYIDRASGGRYINLAPNASVQVVFNAFCANFERENPTAAESFRYVSMPSRLKSISSKISRYMADNFDDDSTIPVQLALWHSQGQSRTAIARKFNFDDSDWEIAARIINY